MRFNKSSGFTLIEVIAVIVVILILAAVAIARLGDLKEGAFESNARQLEREFNKAVTDLTANGFAILPTLQGYTASLQPYLETPHDPKHMGLDSSTYRISNTGEPNTARVKQILTDLNAAYQPYGYVKGLEREYMLRSMLLKLNADLVIAWDPTPPRRAQAIFLEFSPNP